MAPRPAQRRSTRPANQERRPPIVPAALDPLELDGLEDHDGWSEQAITGSAIGADAEHVEIARSTIDRVRFTAAHLRRAELVDVIVTDCDFAGVVFEELVLQRVAFVGCRFDGADLGGATLTDVGFTDCQLEEVGLRMVRAERLVVQGGSAAGIDGYQAWLNGSRWHDVDLTGADLSGAHLERARLHGATLRDVRGARVLTGAVIDHEQVVPVGLSLLADLGVTIDEDR
jgi:uncharacterized protein YjbI with pentapeptide repeats